jgi:hypothetical protein
VRVSWVILSALGAAAAVVPWVDGVVGLDLDIANDLEIADHAIPGGLVAVLGAVGLAGTSAPAAQGPFGATSLAAAGALLTGVWITATHIPLMIDAIGGSVEAGPVILHSVWGPPIAALALLLLLR